LIELSLPVWTAAKLVLFNFTDEMSKRGLAYGFGTSNQETYWQLPLWKPPSSEIYTQLAKVTI